MCGVLTSAGPEAYNLRPVSQYGVLLAVSDPRLSKVDEKAQFSCAQAGDKETTTKTSARILHMAQRPMTKKSGVEDPHQAQTLQNYEAGLRAMQEHKFDKAKGLFQKAIEGAGKELADRARVHLNTCTQRAE